MDHITRSRLVALASRDQFPSVSIYLPLERTGPQIRQNAIRLAHLADDAERKLEAVGMRHPEARDFLEPVRRLCDAPELHGSGPDAGLGLLLSPDGLQQWRFARAMPESVDVGATWYVAPLVSLLTNKEFLLLALSEKHVRLYRLSRSTIELVPLPAGTPGSIAEALPGTEISRTYQYHTSATRDPTGRETDIIHGHGDPKDDRKTLLNDYFHVVVRHLRPFVEREGLPVVLAAVDYYHPLFRAAADGMRLLDAVVIGSPDEFSETELHQRGLQVAAPELDAERTKMIARFEQLRGTERAVDRIEPIVAAARQGRIETLLVAEDLRMWGISGDDALLVLPHDRQDPGDVDLVDFAVRHTLVTQGDVLVLPPDRVPAESGVAAQLRW
ncbi:MAG: hypothetical protein WD069_15535 [Planctomycetales bacterium]